MLAMVFFSLKQGASFGNVLARTLPDIAPWALVAFALTGIIYTGEIDLSVASMIALAGTIFGAAVVRLGWPPWAAFILCVVAAWALMGLNGWIITATGFPAIIVTLAGLPFYRGIALILADWAIPQFSGNISVPGEQFRSPGNSYAAWIVAAGLALALFLDARARTPRMWLALGNSPEACRLLGLSAPKILRSSFLIGGVFFALGTLVYVTRVQSVEPARMALGLELQVIAAVILGGTNIFGGEGSYLGTFLGVLFLYFTSQLLVYLGVSAFLQEAITGGIILGIIGTDCALHRRRKLMEELS